MKNQNIKKMISILFLIPLIFSVITCYRLSKFGGLENRIKIVVYILLILLSLIIFGLGAYLVFGKKIKKNTRIGCSVVLVIFAAAVVGINLYASSLLTKVHETLTNISVSEETYQGSIVVMTESNYTELTDLEGKKIGYFDMESSMEGYIIPHNILEEAKLLDSVTLMPYDDMSALINGLYEGQVDAIMASASYASSFENLDGFADVDMKTKIIATKEETREVEISNTGSVEDLQKPFSVLLMGVDSSTEAVNGKITGNADALFLVTVNPQNYTANITSIPRDSYVPIMCYGDKHRDKITHSNSGGTDCVVNTVANMFDISIDYYIKINFTGLEELVDALGGVYVTVDESRYPDGIVEQNGKRYYESGYKWIWIPAGTNQVSGEQALAFARARHALEGGATERAANQTMVIDGIIKKLLSLETVSKIYDVLDVAGSNIQTNLTVDQMTSLYKLGLDIINRAKGLNLNEAFVLDYYLVSGYDRRIYNESMEMVLYYYVPFEGSIADIKAQVHQNLGLEKYKITGKFAYNAIEGYAKDKAVFYYYNEKQETFTMPDLVPDMYGYTLEEAVAWANSRGISYSVTEIREGDALYNSALPNNFVIDTSEKVNRLVSKVKSITFRVIKNDSVKVSGPQLSFGDYAAEMTLKYGESFSLSSYPIIAKDEAGNTITYTTTIAFEGNTVSSVDTKKPGVYTVTYSATSNNKEASISRKITVLSQTTSSPSVSPSTTPTVSPSPSSTVVPTVKPTTVTPTQTPTLTPTNPPATEAPVVTVPPATEPPVVTPAPTEEPQATEAPVPTEEPPVGE